MFGLMANCFKCLSRRRQPPKKITLVLVGLDNAGKTTTIKGVQGESIEDVAPTVGFSSVNFKMDRCDVTVYDLGGGKKIRDIWKNYYAEVYGVIFVIDASDETRLDECREVLQKVLRQERVVGKRVLVLANKQDQEGALDEIDVCDQLNLEDMVNESRCPCKVQSCSAVQGIGKKMDKSIKEGMQWLLQGIQRDWDTLHERVEGEVAIQREAEAKARKERIARVKKIREEREKKEAEEKKKLGITEEENPDDEDVVMADPFKKLDNQYFEEKKQNEAEAAGKKKKKKAKKAKSESKENLAESSDTPRTAPSSGSQQDLDETKGSGDRVSIGNEDDGEDKRNGMALQVMSSGKDGDGGEDENADDVQPKKKKKKKKFKKNNKTAPMPLDGQEDTNLTPPPIPSWANPSMPTQRPLLKPSHQPTLEPLMEGPTPRVSPRPNPRLQPLQPLQPIGDLSSRGGGGGGGLPPLSGPLSGPFGPRRTRPNSEQDDEVVT